MSTNDLLKTPQQFIEEETENIKTYLSDRNDVQINKLGVIGFMINLLGNIRYDATQYYQNLFAESNVTTARDENNLYMHSSIYGYTPSFATPSQANGTFSFNFSNLSVNSSAIKRSVIFKSIQFKVNDIQFKTDTVYKFVQESQNYYVIVYLSDGTIKHIPASSSTIIAPFFEVYQVTEEIESLEIPNYDYLTYYSNSFTTDDQYLSNISVYVKENNVDYTTTYGDEYEVKLVKFLENSYSKSCFLKMNSSNSYKLEFGSGIRGKYIPLSTATIIKNITYGDAGHISVETTTNPTNTSIIILRTYSTSTSYTESYLSSKLITVNFTNSLQGINPKTGNDLRNSIIEYVQTRDFLIDKQDYENLTNIDDNEFVYSFKKSQLQRNDFYLYQVLRDENQIPVKSFCVNFPVINTINAVQNLSSTNIIESDGDLSTGSYVYSVHASDGFHISTISTISVSLPVGYNGIELNWDSYNNAQIYMISVYDGMNYRHFSVFENSFIDLGQISENENNFITEIGDTDTISPIYSWENSYIFFPEFEVNDTEFISPFVYKYNSFMNWFEGNLFYDDFVVLFSQKNINTSTVNQNYTVPQFHLRIQYNYVSKTTRMTIISPQDCSGFIGKISISNTSITSQKVTRLSSNTFYIDYNENDYGILFNEYVVDFDVYYCDSNDIINSSVLTQYTTAEFKQIESMVDQLKLIKYIDEDDNSHLLNIPVLEKSIYEADIEDYNIKILSNMYTTGLSYKRFPNDEIQYRFLNTYFIEYLYLRNIIKQTYDFTMYFPLLLTVNIIFDEIYINSTTIDLTTEKDNLYLDIANKLQDSYTGHKITFYNSQLIDFIHSERSFIKSVGIIVSDSNSNIISSGIEVYDEDTIMENIQSDSFDTDEGNTKTNIAYYNPGFFWWDVDNITINYSFN